MTVRTHWNAYVNAFNGRDLAAAVALFDERGVFEMPLLGQRLFGRHEIEAGLRQLFAITESARMQFTDPKESKNIVIAEGRLHAKLHRDSSAVDIPLAVVMESSHDEILRVSTYLDARPFRLWADGPLFASAHSCR